MATETQLIWTEFGDRLRVFIARRVGNEADADDVLQEVFLRVHRYGGTVERSEHLVGWLFQVTRNAIADYHRAPARRRELPAGASYHFDAGLGLAGDEADGPEVLSAPAWQELAACLRPMVDRLPPPYREAVTMVDLDGAPQAEAAARVGLSLPGMKSRVQRGRRALKRLLQECCRIELDAGGRVTDYRPRGPGCTPGANPCGDGGCAPPA